MEVVRWEGRGVRQFSADDQNHKSKLQAAGKRPSSEGYAVWLSLRTQRELI